MNVRELIDLLKNYHDEMEVFLSSDAEGNSLSPLVQLSPEAVAKINDFEYEFDDYSGADSLILWPMN